MNEQDPWVEYVVVTPGAADPTVRFICRMSGPKRVMWPELEQFVRAYRAIGIEPEVTEATESRVEVPT